jgi:ferritin
MLDPKMEQALNDQVNAELHSAYVYLAMSGYFEDRDLTGCAHWMRVQAQEEIIHAMKIFTYIVDRDGRATTAAIAQPANEFESPLAAFEVAYKHEIYITGRIGKLVNLAREIGDHSSENFLQWYVAEQVEEEAQVKEIIQKFKLAGKEGQGMFLIDREVGTRMFVYPPDIRAI